MDHDATVISGQGHDEEIVQAVIDSLPTLYYLVDAEGRIVRWNLKSLEVTGHSAAEHSRLNMLDLFEGADKAHIAQRMRTVFEAGEAGAEARLLTRDGRKIPYHFNGKRIHVQGRPYLSCIGIDISERKAMEDQLMLQATTDSLTGVFNRRHFLHLAEQELVRAKRYGSPLSLLMLDLDHFKSINDRYGHQTGDAVLQELMRICRKVVRFIDGVGRLGGEEFAILLPDTDIKGAIQLAERLCQSIAESRIVLGDSAGSLSITASIGVATLVTDCSINELLAAADRELYAAKKAGRNRVSVAQEQPVGQPRRQ